MKVACSFIHEPQGALPSVSAMADAMRLFDRQRCLVFSAGREGALACVENFDRFSSIKLQRANENGNTLLVAGVPLDLHGSLDERLEHIVRGDYRRAGSELCALDGAFAALFWDAVEEKLLVVTDPLGLQPLYMAHQEDRFFLGSELKAFPATGSMDVEMDPAGWGAFIGFGFPIGSRTQLAGVRRVEPARKMVYDPRTGSLDSETYWQWPELSPELTREDVDTGLLVESLQKEINAYAQYTTGGSVLLSGGFDSRLTLALLDQAGWDVNALVLAHQDELRGEDGRLARESAGRLGVEIEFIRPPRGYYNSHHFLDYLVMNEVTTPSLYLFIAQVSAYIGDDRGVVWDGTPPGYGLVPAFLPEGGFDVLLQHIQAKRDAYVWQMADKTFGKKRADEFFEAVEALVLHEIAKYPDDEMGVTRFEVMNRMRNRTIPNCLKVYSNKAMPFVPAVSRPFWDYAGSIPYSATREYLLYHLIFRKHFPSLAEIPFLSGGGLWCDPEMGMRRRVALARHSFEKSGFVRFSRKLYRRWIRRSRRYWDESRFVELVRSRLECLRDEVDVDGLQTLDPQASLPFYWQTWRWIMQGKLTTWNSGDFFES
ncbi:MAG: hypothetical protein PVG49_05925 [Desulfobacteraceae bacterium]|jgi:hypothetical protein